MANKYTPLLGVCPIGKFVFSNEDAIAQKNKLFNKLDAWNVNYCDIDEVLPDGLVRDQKDTDKVIKHFKDKKIDALFLPHCNFGTEGAVGMIGKTLNVPVLLWGPRDEAPMVDGTRLRDSLCGMFASSKVLHKLKIQFSYIENCTVDDSEFKKRLDVFLGACAVVKSMKSMKIAIVGSRIDFFWSTICSESELLEKFGIQVLPVDICDFIGEVKKRAEKNKEQYIEEMSDIEKYLEADDFSNKNDIINGLAFRDELLKLAKDEELDAFTIQSFFSLPNALGPAISLGSALAAEIIPIADESDIHGAISLVLINAAKATSTPCFFPEYTVRHPENDNAILLWHGGAPLSLRYNKQDKISVKPPWILKSDEPSSLQYQLMDGNLTVCRFDGDDSEYFLGIGEGKTVSGPITRDYYLWMEVNDWPKWERQIIEGPYIHHCACAYDHCAEVLNEACRFISGLTAQRYDKK